MERAERRSAHLRMLNERGFRPAEGLPLQRRADGADTLRAPREIALRVCALDVLFKWVAFDEPDAPEARVRNYAERSRLADGLTPSERAIWEAPRSAIGAHRHTIGWRLENVWALAWSLGFEPAPEVSGAMVPRAISESIVWTFLPKLDGDLDELMTRARPRSEDEVDALEDLFYCAHNAARSAQSGHAAAVPPGFDPRSGGGVIHERRHALTWALSRGVPWDETDLST